MLENIEEIKCLQLLENGEILEIDCLSDTLDNAISHLGCWENELAFVDIPIDEYLYKDNWF